MLAQPKRPVDTQHCVRLMIGNGLNREIWAKFVKRFQIPNVTEFYGSTEGNVSMVNPFNKVGACGCISVVLSPFNPVVLVKVDTETGEYVRDSRGFCIKAGPNETGEVAGKIRQRVLTSHFEGYSDAEASKKKVKTDLFSPGDKFFMSGDILRMDDQGFLYFCDRLGDTFRWKGENVSTAEVESIISNILQLRDVVVYGVEVPRSEGRAGMAAIVGTEESMDITQLAQQLFLSLPTYAVPLFIRLVSEAELTGTFKLKKVKLRSEAYNVTLPDPLFLLDASKKTYKPLTEELYHQIQDGKIKL